MEKIIYLHPGQPKTGTSFLQRNLFVPHPEINNLGKINNHLPAKADLLKVFYKVMNYEKLSEDDYSNCLKIINSIDYKEGFVNLISFEGFMQLNFKINQELIFKRLKSLFTDSNFKLKI